MWFIQKIKSSLIITNINIYVRDAPSLTVFNDGRISSEGMIKKNLFDCCGFTFDYYYGKKTCTNVSIKEGSI
jgi:hypothetical protein